MDQKLRNQGEIIKMAGNNAIQILRANTQAIANSTETLLDGQLLYNTDKNYLTCGGGGANNVNSLPITCRELVAYQGDEDAISNNTTETASIRHNANGLQVFSSTGINVKSSGKAYMNTNGATWAFQEGNVYFYTAANMCLSGGGGESTLEMNLTTAQLNSYDVNIFANTSISLDGYGNGIAITSHSNNIRLNATDVTANCNIVSPSFVATDDQDAMTFSMKGTTEQVTMGGSIHTTPSAYLYVNSNSGNIPIMQFGYDGGGYSYMRLMNVPSLSTVYVPGGSSFHPQGTTINSARVYLTSNYGISMKASTSNCYANINTSGNVVQLFLSDNASQYPAYTVYRSNQTIQGYWYANGWKNCTWTFPDKSGTVALTSDLSSATVTSNPDGTVNIVFN